MEALHLIYQHWFITALLVYSTCFSIGHVICAWRVGRGK